MNELGEFIAISIVFGIILWLIFSIVSKIYEYTEELNCENENNVYSCQMIWVPEEKEEIK